MPSRPPAPSRLVRPEAAKAPVRVLGLDPGSHVTGYGLVEEAGRGLRLVAAGAIRPPGGGDLASRLAFIHAAVARLVAEHAPAEAAVEGVFTAQNVRSALILGHARGVALLAVAQAGIEVFEYSPAAIKKALVGTGRAAKEQVRAMVAALVGQPPPGPLDASDALAVAITHLHSRPLIKRGLA